MRYFILISVMIVAMTGSRGHCSPLRALQIETGNDSLDYGYYDDCADDAEVMDSAAADTADMADTGNKSNIVEMLSYENLESGDAVQEYRPEEPAGKPSKDTSDTSLSTEQIVSGLIGLAILYYGGKWILGILGGIGSLFDFSVGDNKKRKRKEDDPDNSWLDDAWFHDHGQKL